MSYAGRNSDLLILHAPGQVGQMSLSLNPGRIATGIQKAAQRWLLCFLTVKGTVVGDPDYGSSFITELRHSNAADESNVAKAFGAASEEVMIWLDNNLSDLPDDEKIIEAKLLNYSLSEDTATLRVLLTTLAGLSREFITPLSVVTRG